MIKQLTNIQQKVDFEPENVLSWTNMRENPHKNGNMGHIISSKLTFLVNDMLELCILLGQEH